MSKTKSNRCLYHSTFSEFVNADPKALLGTLITAYHGEALTTTVDAWVGEIAILQSALLPWKDEDAEIIFEYDIPRLGKRIDVVLLLRGMIFCLEFKVNQASALQADVEQVLDYALDLKNFHLLSHDRIIVPILVPTAHSSSTTAIHLSVYDDQICNPLISGAAGLSGLISRVIAHFGANVPASIPNWIISNYAPTPTIVEAARALYMNHSVDNITRHSADKVTTDQTIAYIQEVIARTKANNEKSICFVTGVPGAGKTLVGLDVAVKQSYDSEGQIKEEDGAVYLSGNGPLVAVLTEALARDNYQKCKESGKSNKNKSDCRREVSKFIQMIHRYRDNMLAKIKNPVADGVLDIDPEKALKLAKTGYGEVEHVAIFDEAQRSWTQEHLAKYLKRGGTYGNKLKVPNFPVSEAAFLIWSMDQREDWATIVCLVGGGQEINTGEDGIKGWIEAINDHFPHWKVYISEKLTDKEYAEGNLESLLAKTPSVTYSSQLHLAVSLRSFRSEMLSAFVHSLLSFDPDAAALYGEVVENGYPIMLTRDINAAREWMRRKARGSEKTGLLVSKVAARFKPLAVSILAAGDDNAVHWFLEDKTDSRSSDFLEDAATEIQVQGLELDYACVVWDADMRCDNGAWTYWKYNGSTRWNPEKNLENQKYMLNAYRVLLTRARQGIVICVPEGNSKLDSNGFPEDPTRIPENYDSTFNYFLSLGLPLLPE